MLCSVCVCVCVRACVAVKVGSSDLRGEWKEELQFFRAKRMKDELEKKRKQNYTTEGISFPTLLIIFAASFSDNLWCSVLLCVEFVSEEL